MKNNTKWTENQIQRAAILFEKYPDLEQAYKFCQTYLGYSIKQRIKHQLRLDWKNGTEK